MSQESAETGRLEELHVRTGHDQVEGLLQAVLRIGDAAIELFKALISACESLIIAPFKN
jgi:hypothetical protein